MAAMLVNLTLERYTNMAAMTSRASGKHKCIETIYLVAHSLYILMFTKYTAVFPDSKGIYPGLAWILSKIFFNMKARLTG
jgi:hypothetical protein